MQIVKIFLLILSLVPLVSWANTSKVIRVIDGDTVIISAPYLPPPLKPQLSLRIHGIDTPEKNTRAKCSREHQLAEQATLHTLQTIQNGKNHRIVILEWDKYGGRVLGDIIVDNRSLRDSLLEKNWPDHIKVRPKAAGVKPI
jgi:micrococcal nuclease